MRHGGFQRIYFQTTTDSNWNLGYFRFRNWELEVIDFYGNLVDNMTSWIISTSDWVMITKTRLYF